VISVVELVGTTVPSIPRISVGYVNDRQRAVFQFRQVRDPFADLTIGPGAAGDLGRPATSGLMLYRNVVPEPDSVALIALFIAGISKYSLCVGGAT